MAWKFPWSEFVKKRACRYLLQHYVGQFLKEKLTLDQLSVDLFNGTGTIRQLDLDVEALNETLDQCNIPLEIVDGFIEEITVSIPWTALIQNSTEMQIQGLEVTLQPKQRNLHSHGLESMFSSTSSMTTSLQIAKDCFKSDKEGGGHGGDAGPQFEGVQKFAQTIDSVLSRIKVTLVDTIVRLEHLPHGADAGVALEIKIKRMEFFDDMAMSEGSSVDNITHSNKWEPPAIAHKNFVLEGVQIFLDQFSRNSQQQDQPDSTCSSPQAFHSATSSLLGPKSGCDQSTYSPGSREPQSDPIHAATITGKTGIKLKIKQDDSVGGPKLEVAVDIGALHMLFSPKQFHLLLELIEGLSSPVFLGELFSSARESIIKTQTITKDGRVPTEKLFLETFSEDEIALWESDTNDRSSKRYRSSKSKPMTSDDIQLVERELQQQCQAHRVQQQLDCPSLQDIMTRSLGEEEIFHSMTPGGRKADLESSISSNCSLSSNKSSSTVTTTSSKQTVLRTRKDSYKSRETEDPSAELCKYHLRLAFFSISILHENPRPELSQNASKATKMKDISESFFRRVLGFTAAGMSDLRDMRKLFVEGLHCDHLRFIGKPLTIDCTETTGRTHYNMNLELTVASFEAIECLFDRRNENVKPEYTELLVFQRDVVDSKPSQMYSSMHGGSPCFKAYIRNESVLGTRKAGSIPKTDVSITLGHLESEIDITIVDRINSLITPEPNRRPYNNMATTYTGGVTPYSFTQALEEGSVTQDRKVDIQISCPAAKLSLWFPIPDLRPSSQVDKLPWWQKNLRDEIIILNLTDAMIQMICMSGQPPQQVELTCTDIQASFRIDPNQDPVPFAYVCGDENEDGVNTLPRMCVKFSNKTISLLEEDHIEPEDSSLHMDSFDGACQFAKKAPSPFSSKMFMYGKEEGGSQTKHVSEEMIMPGDRKEMLEFQDIALANTHMTVEFSLPNVNLYVPSQHFYEVLYNRINSDLLLWEPMAPSPLQTQDTGGISMQPFDLSCYPHAFTDSFTMAKSALKSDSSDEEDDSSYGYYSIHDSKYPRHPQRRKEQPSKMCLSLKIDKGKLTAITKSKVEKTHGVVVCLLDDASLFTVVNHNGDPSLQYICFLSNKAELYHGSEVSDNNDVPVAMTLKDISTVPNYLQACKTIYKSSSGVKVRPTSDMAYDLDPQDMVSVAVKIRLDSTPINDLTRDEKIKEFLVSVGIRGGTLRHRMADSGQSWISQILNFLDVKDYDVLGYNAAKVITELHVHLWSCAVDYRPEHHPTKAILTAESFSISSNIVAESPTSLLRFVLDDASLYLTQKMITSPPNLRKNYVCVADLERFELALRFSEGKDLKFPKTDMKVSTNRLNIRTCSDSCKALMELIQYFANDGDLEDVSKSEMEDQIEVQDIGVGDDRRDSDSEDEKDSSGLSESRLEHFQQLVADAMEESSAPGSGSVKLPTEGTEKSKRKATTEVYFVTDGQGSSKTPMSIQRPIVISDSADSIASSALSERTETFSDDEDFCIIDSPGLGISPRDGEPAIHVITEEQIVIKENYFSQPLGRTDLLKAPDHYPPAEYRYTLKELTLVWYMYGGRDFGPPINQEKECVTVNRIKDVKGGSPIMNMKYIAKGTAKDIHKTCWQYAGGPGRDTGTLMELQFSKVRMQHEIYSSNTSQASRQILLVHDAEIRDRLSSSNINKFLYQYSSETMPKQTYSNMLLVKAVHTRPDPSLRAEECALRVSLQPLKLNVDQDSLSFLKSFFNEITGSHVETQMTKELQEPTTTGASARGRVSSGATAPSPPPPVMTVVHPEVSEEDSNSQEPLMVFDDEQHDEQLGGMIPERRHSFSSDHSSCSSQHQAAESADQRVYFKSFIFSPDVPIRLDYHGKKISTEHGTLAGLLAGLAQLNCSELKLKRLNYQHGLLGLERVLQYSLHEWLTDIKKSQLPSILGGVGPMHSFVQLAQGMKDLFWLPVEQYKKDGRIVRGIQRGASSFTTSTAMSVLELTNRLVQSVQYVAEVTFDMVSPGPSVRETGQRRRKKYGRSGQPADLREGVTNAYIVLKEGFSDTAHNIVSVATTEHEKKGVTGAVGGVMRQIPPTVISPLIIASEATSNVLGGMRNQIKPDARKEDEDKWKIEHI